MKYDVYNLEGKKVGQTLLPNDIFEVEVNSNLIHQVLVSQMANRRKVIAHTKDRKEVRGGGKKPWRQKGTGRARHGSIRSPLWKRGGVTFGPNKERVFKKRIPKKMKRKALFMVLSAKAKNKLLFIFDKLEIAKPKTKEMVQIIENLKTNIKDLKQGSILIALVKGNKNIILATRNIPKTETVEARNLNTLSSLSIKYLIVPKEAIGVIKETFLKPK